MHPASPRRLGGERRPRVKVLTPSHQPDPSSSLQSGNPKQSHPQMMLRREAGSESSLHPLPFNPFTATAPSRTARPAGLGAPRPKHARSPPRGQESQSFRPQPQQHPLASFPPLLSAFGARPSAPRYNGGVSLPGSDAGAGVLAGEPAERRRPHLPGTQCPSSALPAEEAETTGTAASAAPSLGRRLDLHPAERLGAQRWPSDPALPQPAARSPCPAGPLHGAVG